MNKLEEICLNKLDEVKAAKKQISQDEIEKLAAEMQPAKGFERSLKERIDAGKPAVIAEIKKASPSVGVIREDFDVAAIAKEFETNGAACLSVLTDQKYFQGSEDDLRTARVACKLPIIRKDFMVDPYQIYEARSWGADAILLIMAALSDDQAREMEYIAQELGMAVLVETHSKEEIYRALCLKSYLIGVNNRNLKTLQVDLEVGKHLSAHIPDSYIGICESGIKTAKDIEVMGKFGYKAFLVGEGLARDPDLLK